MRPIRPEDWQAISARLERALDLPPLERRAWLDRLEGDEPEVARELRSMLAAADRPEYAAFLAEPVPSQMRVESPESLAGTRIGPYLIESEIGRGGMGSVWRARRADGLYEGCVAIKFVHAAWMGREGEQRFRREGKLLARLAHPRIARLIDMGALESGQPYLVLEYVEGEAIDVHCEQRRLDLDERIRLFVPLLDAVAHAHAQLIVHRDIKPSNIVVTAAQTPVLLDFGIAKLLDPDDDLPALTRASAPALTPEFAAPEQLAGEPVTTATDVYALGLVLYRLLTGSHPWADRLGNTARLIAAMLSGEPPRASAAAPKALARRLQGDLDNILAKALRREPHERYASVGALADDLNRYLTHQPVLARPDTIPYRMTKFVRRHRGGVTTALLTLFALVAATLITADQMIEARRERDLAEMQLRRSEAFGDLVAIVLSESDDPRDVLTPRELLDRSERLVRAEFADQPTLRAQLLITLGKLYAQAGLTAKQRATYSEASAAAVAGGDAATAARAGCALAAADAVVGAGGDAAARVARYLDGLPRDRSADRARAACLSFASVIARVRGDFAQAVTSAERATAIERDDRSTTDWQRLSSLITLADAQRSAGRFAQADGSYRRVADGYARLHVDRTGFAATLYNNWAVDLEDLGQPQRAASLLKPVIEAERRVAGQDAFSRVVYAAALVALARADDARRVLEPALDAAVANGNRISASQVRLALVTTYGDLGEFDRAGAMLARVAADLPGMLPAGHEAFGALHLAAARLAERRGDYAAAAREAQSAIGIFDSRANLRFRAGAARIVLAEALLGSGRTHEALTTVGAAIDALRAIASPTGGSADLGRAWLVDARIDAALGDRPAAVRAAAAAREQLLASVGAGHPLTIEAARLAGS